VRSAILTFLLKTSSFMPFFNGDASVMMGAVKNKPPHSFTPAMTGNFMTQDCSLRAQATDTAPERARPDCGAAGGTCRCDSGTSD
jgi:hypothetical protein